MPEGLFCRSVLVALPVGEDKAFSLPNPYSPFFTRSPTIATAGRSPLVRVGGNFSRPQCGDRSCLGLERFQYSCNRRQDAADLPTSSQAFGVKPTTVMGSGRGPARQRLGLRQLSAAVASSARDRKATKDCRSPKPRGHWHNSPFGLNLHWVTRVRCHGDNFN